MPTSVVEQLLDLIADIGHDRELLDERERLARELLATFQAEESARDVSRGEQAVVEAVAKPTETKPKATVAEAGAKGGKIARANARQVPCPDCGEMYVEGPGLALHRRSAHPGSAAKPVAPIEPSKKPEREDRSGEYECGDCGTKRATPEGLSEHTWAAHKRPPRIAERRPTTAAA